MENRFYKSSPTLLAQYLKTSSLNSPSDSYEEQSLKITNLHRDYISTELHKCFLDTFILCLSGGSLPHMLLRIELVLLFLKNAFLETHEADDAQISIRSLDDSSLISYTQAQTAESTLVN